MAIKITGANRAPRNEAAGLQTGIASLNLAERPYLFFASVPRQL